MLGGAWEYEPDGLPSSTQWNAGGQIALPHSIALDVSYVTIQVRADLFNAPKAAAITGRNAAMNLTNPLNPSTITNLPFDPNGQLIDARSRPRGAGFGVANAYQTPRAIQLQVRFTF
jgi:hypothetical protein